MLEVVEQEQDFLVGDVLRDLPLRVQHLCDRVAHERGVAQCRERYPPNSCWELLRRLGGGLNRKARLAGSTRAGQRQHPARAEQAENLA
jgi:hypothetical protein